MIALLRKLPPAWGFGCLFGLSGGLMIGVLALMGAGAPAVWPQGLWFAAVFTWLVMILAAIRRAHRREEEVTGDA